MSHGVALAIGVGVGFVGSVLVHLPPVRRWRRQNRRRQLGVTLTAWLVAPIVVAALMPNFIDAILVLLGNAIGGAISMVVTLPMTFATRQPRP